MPPPDAPRPATAVRLVAYTAILFASWNHNLLGIPDSVGWARGEPRAGYLGLESHLVVHRLAHPDLHPLHPLVGRTADDRLVPYPSQVGLSGIVLAAGTALGLPPAGVALGGGAASALLAALVVAAVFASAQRWLGAPASDAACVLAASTPVFLPFAPSLYWAAWLLLAPFALVWCLAPRATTRPRRIALAAAVGLAVLAKCLCGYEYITTVILAPVAAAWFHHHRAGDSLGRRVLTAAALVGVGLLGFAAAMALHVGQLGAVLGQDGVEVIRNRAAVRTASDPQAEALSGAVGEARPSRAVFAAACFRSYFDQRAVSVAGGFGRVRKDVPLRVVVALAVAFAVGVGVARKRLPREAAALAGAVVVGLAAGLSWQVLAVNHMCVHRHLNLIVFAVPFLPLAYLAAGYTLRLLTGEPFGRRVGPVLLAIAAAVMMVNVATDARRRGAEAAEQEAAEAAVAARLGGAIPANGDGLGGAVDLARSEAVVSDALLIEYGRLAPDTGRPADPGALVLNGWALGDCRPTTRPTTRLVVACGGAVVPCEVLRFRRPDIEAAVGRSVAGTGFVAFVPSTALSPGAPVRVFVVSAADPTRMAELTLPH